MKDQNKKQLARVMDYKNVFGSESGKRVLYDMMQSSHMLSPIPPLDALKMAYAEGERNAILRILAILKTDPKKLEDYINKNIKENGDTYE